MCNVACINRLAEKFKRRKPTQLTKFKAALEATEEKTVLGAAQIAFHMTMQTM